MGEIARMFANTHSDEGRLLNKITSYAPVYEELLDIYRGGKVNLVEIGISHGGCLQMWRSFLGPLSRIWGLDSADHTLYEEDRIKCYLIDQSKKEDLESIHKLIPSIDIFIDDASHFSKHQVDTFESVFPHMNKGGLYFCEDTHCSYRSTHDGEYLKPGTFMEFAKGLCDSMNHQEDQRIPRPSYIDSIYSITFYHSLVVFKKL